MFSIIILLYFLGNNKFSPFPVCPYQMILFQYREIKLQYINCIVILSKQFKSNYLFSKNLKIKIYFLISLFFIEFFFSYNINLTSQSFNFYNNSLDYKQQ